MSISANVVALAQRVAEEFRAVRSEKADVQHTHAVQDVSGLQTALDGKASTSHTHDDRYYTETEVDNLLSGKANAEHSHSIEDVAELQDELDGKSNVGHTHSEYALTSHNHNGVYDPAGTASAAVSSHTSDSHPHTQYLRRQDLYRQGTSASSINADNVDIVDLTLNSNVTLSVPTNGFNGKTIQVTALANGADRTLTFHTNFKRLDGIQESYQIPQDQYLRAAVRRTGSNTWIVEAVGVTT